MTKHLQILTEAVNRSLNSGMLTPVKQLNTPQKEALQGYLTFLNQDTGNSTNNRRAYFDMATGTGKTGLFSTIANHTFITAQEMGEIDRFRTIIIVPTTFLLKQTKDKLIETAPALKSAVGTYGDGSKDNSKPITIMTYDAWVDLLESGQLSDDNVGLDINDEAHHSLSWRRQQLINNRLAKTVHIGTTATAQYDGNRTLEQTHHNLIYKLDLREAVERGFLCDYVHVQYGVVRILLPSAERVDPDLENVNFTLLKRQLWSRLTTHAFSTFKDDISGAPLSDKIATFFTADTRHANIHTALLNANPILKQKAMAGGFKDVAVAIHSKGISPREQDRRFEDFLAGRYMAVVGDKKFQAGFDHPPVKFTASFPGSSPVDIIQEIGRSTRYWADPITGKSQGTVAFEAIPYIGSTNPQEDEKARRSALANCITSYEILGRTLVLSPRRKLEEQQTRKVITPTQTQKTGSGKASSEKNIKTVEGNKTSDITTRDLVGTEATFIQNPLPITARVGGQDSQVPPQSAPIVPLGQQATAQVYLTVEDTLTISRQIDTARAEIKHSERIEVTSEMMNALYEQLSKRGMGDHSVGPVQLLRSIEKYELESKLPGLGITLSSLEGFLKGRLQTISPEVWARINEAVLTIPERFTVTPKIRRELLSKLRKRGNTRFGLGPIELERKIKVYEAERGLESFGELQGVLAGIMGGATKTVLPQIWERVNKVIDATPERVIITAKLLKTLLDKLEKRKGRVDSSLGAIQIAEKIAEYEKQNNLPRHDLAAHKIQDIIRGKLKAVDADIWNIIHTVIDLVPERKTITSKELKGLQEKLKKRGKANSRLGPHKLAELIKAHQTSSSKPSTDITPDFLGSIVAGKTKTIEKSIWTLINEAIDSIPERITVSQKQLSAFNKKLKKLGSGESKLGPARLAKYIEQYEEEKKLEPLNITDGFIHAITKGITGTLDGVMWDRINLVVDHLLKRATKGLPLPSTKKTPKVAKDQSIPPVKTKDSQGDLQIREKGRASPLLASFAFLTANFPELVSALQIADIHTRFDLAEALAAKGMYKGSKSSLCVSRLLEGAILDDRRVGITLLPFAKDIAEIAQLDPNIAYSRQLAAAEKTDKSKPLNSFSYLKENFPEILAGLEKAGITRDSQLVDALVKKIGTTSTYGYIAIPKFLEGELFDARRRRPVLTVIARHMAELAGLSAETVYAKQLKEAENKKAAEFSEGIEKSEENRSGTKKGRQSASLNDFDFLMNEAPELLSALIQKGVHTRKDLVDVFVKNGMKQPAAYVAVSKFLSGEISNKQHSTFTLTNMARSVAGIAGLEIEVAYAKQLNEQQVRPSPVVEDFQDDEGEASLEKQEARTVSQPIPVSPPLVDAPEKPDFKSRSLALPVYTGADQRSAYAKELSGYLSGRIAQFLAAELREFSAERKRVWETQQECLQAVASSVILPSEKSRYLITSATGSGKTNIFMLINALASEKIIKDDKKIVIVTPTNSLVKQTYERGELVAPHIWFDSENPESDRIGRLNTWFKDYDRPVIVTTPNSFLAALKSGALKAEDIALLNLDEAHTTAMSDLRQQAISELPNALILAFTATPKYSAGRSLEKLGYQEIYRLDAEEAVERKVISPFVNVVIKTDVADLSKVKTLPTGSYDPLALSHAINRTDRNSIGLDFYKTWVDEATGIPMFGQVGFINCTDIDHANSVVKLFNEDVQKDPERWKGIVAAGQKVAVALHSDVPKKERERILREHQEGKILLVVGVDMIAVGIDNIEASVCINLAPTLSQVFAAQRGGRVLRVDENRPDKFAYVADIVDERGPDKKPVLFTEAIGASPDAMNNWRRRHGKEPASVTSLNPPAPHLNYHVISDVFAVSKMAEEFHDQREKAAEKPPFKEENDLTVQEVLSALRKRFSPMPWHQSRIQNLILELQKVGGGDERDLTVEDGSGFSFRAHWRTSHTRKVFCLDQRDLSKLVKYLNKQDELLSDTANLLSYHQVEEELQTSSPRIKKLFDRIENQVIRTDQAYLPQTGVTIQARAEWRGTNRLVLVHRSALSLIAQELEIATEAAPAGYLTLHSASQYTGLHYSVLQPVWTRIEKAYENGEKHFPNIEEPIQAGKFRFITGQMRFMVHQSYIDLVKQHLFRSEAAPKAKIDVIETVVPSKPASVSLANFAFLNQKLPELLSALQNAGINTRTDLAEACVQKGLDRNSVQPLLGQFLTDNAIDSSVLNSAPTFIANIIAEIAKLPSEQVYAKLLKSESREKGLDKFREAEAIKKARSIPRELEAPPVMERYSPEEFDFDEDTNANSAPTEIGLSAAYQRELAGIELLSAEEEIIFAKRIEAARQKIISGLIKSPMVVKLLRDQYVGIAEGKIALNKTIEISLLDEELVSDLSAAAQEKRKEANVEAVKKSAYVARRLDQFLEQRNSDHDIRSAEQEIVDLVFSLRPRDSVLNEWIAKVGDSKGIELQIIGHARRSGVSIQNFLKAYEGHERENGWKDFLKGTKADLDKIDELQAKLVFFSDEAALSVSQFQAMAATLRSGQTELDKAKHEMTEANLKLAAYIARKYMNRGLSLEDLTQEANIGLMTAVEKFDYRYKFRFATPAWKWIQQAIARAIADKGNNIRIPVHAFEKFIQLGRLKAKTFSETGREPTIPEIAKALEISEEFAGQLLTLPRANLSLDTPVKQGSLTTIGEQTIDDDAPDPLNEVMTIDMQERLAAALATLPLREADVLRMRFGINMDSDHTLEEVGEHFKVTRERIRQIEAKALGKMKKKAKRFKLRDDLDGTLSAEAGTANDEVALSSSVPEKIKRKRGALPAYVPEKIKRKRGVKPRPLTGMDVFRNLPELVEALGRKNIHMILDLADVMAGCGMSKSAALTRISRFPQDGIIDRNKMAFTRMAVLLAEIAEVDPQVVYARQVKSFGRPVTFHASGFTETTVVKQPTVRAVEDQSDQLSDARSRKGACKGKRIVKSLKDIPLMLEGMPEVLEALAKKHIYTNWDLIAALIRKGLTPANSREGVHKFLDGHFIKVASKSSKIVYDYCSQQIAEISGLQVEAAYQRLTEVLATSRVNNDKTIKKPVVEKHNGESERKKGKKSQPLADYSVFEKMPELRTALAALKIITRTDLVKALVEKGFGKGNAEVSVMNFLNGEVVKRSKNLIFTRAAKQVADLAGLSCEIAYAVQIESFNSSTNNGAKEGVTKSKNSLNKREKLAKLAQFSSGELANFIKTFPSFAEKESEICAALIERNIRSLGDLARAMVARGIKNDEAFTHIRDFVKNDTTNAHLWDLNKEAAIISKIAAEPVGQVQHQDVNLHKKNRGKASQALAGQTIFPEKMSELLAALVAKGISTRSDLARSLVERGLTNNNAKVGVFNFLSGRIIKQSATAAFASVALLVADIAGLEPVKAYARLLEETGQSPLSSLLSEKMSKLSAALEEAGIRTQPDLVKALRKKGLSKESAEASVSQFLEGNIHRKSATSEYTFAARHIADIAGLSVDIAYGLQSGDQEASQSTGTGQEEPVKNREFSVDQKSFKEENTEKKTPEVAEKDSKDIKADIQYVPSAKNLLSGELHAKLHVAHIKGGVAQLVRSAPFLSTHTPELLDALERVGIRTKTDLCETLIERGLNQPKICVDLLLRFMDGNVTSKAGELTSTAKLIAQIAGLTEWAAYKNLVPNLPDSTRPVNAAVEAVKAKAEVTLLASKKTLLAPAKTKPENRIHASASDYRSFKIAMSVAENVSLVSSANQDWIGLLPSIEQEILNRVKTGRRAIVDYLLVAPKMSELLQTHYLVIANSANADEAKNSEGATFANNIVLQLRTYSENAKKRALAEKWGAGLSDEEERAFKDHKSSLVSLILASGITSDKIDYLVKKFGSTYALDTAVWNQARKAGMSDDDIRAEYEGQETSHGIAELMQDLGGDFYEIRNLQSEIKNYSSTSGLPFQVFKKTGLALCEIQQEVSAIADELVKSLAPITERAISKYDSRGLSANEAREVVRESLLSAIDNYDGQTQASSCINAIIHHALELAASYNTSKSLGGSGQQLKEAWQAGKKAFTDPANLESVCQTIAAIYEELATSRKFSSGDERTAEDRTATILQGLGLVNVCLTRGPEQINQLAFSALLDIDQLPDLKGIGSKIFEAMNDMMEANPRAFDGWEYPFLKLRKLASGQGAGRNPRLAALANQYDNHWSKLTKNIADRSDKITGRSGTGSEFTP